MVMSPAMPPANAKELNAVRIAASVCTRFHSWLPWENCRPFLRVHGCVTALRWLRRVVRPVAEDEGTSAGEAGCNLYSQLRHAATTDTPGGRQATVCK